MRVPFNHPMVHEEAIRTLLLCKQVFEDLKTPFWLAAGTLLGAIRENDFILHDADIDLGVWNAEPDHGRIRQAFLDKGFEFLKEFGTETEGHQYTVQAAPPGYVKVDIFFHEQEPDCCWLPLWIQPGVCKRCVYPPITSFVPYTLFGTEFPIPANYEEVLTAQYGPEWRVPVAPVELGGWWQWDSSPRNLK